MNPTVVLDFDRVLFDTDGFIKKLEEEGLGDIPRGEELLKAIEDKRIDWQEYVDKEALAYLQNTSDHTIILTSTKSRVRKDNDVSDAARELFQRKKIELCGIEEAVNKVVVVPEGKMEELKKIKLDSNQVIFLDDEIDHIKDAKELGIHTVWFRTTKNIIQNTNEGLPQHIESVNVTSFHKFLEKLNEWRDGPSERVVKEAA